MTLGKRIAMLRRQKGLKQEDLANTLGVSSQAVSKWENDQTCPDISLLPKLAEIWFYNKCWGQAMSLTP